MHTTESAGAPAGPPLAFGRYVLLAPIAHGGMATIHLARLVGDDGFSRLVAAKRLHPQFTEDPEFVAMFRDEAQIASHIRHPNVVPVVDVVVVGRELILVQEYVHGVPLDKLFRAAVDGGAAVPVRIAVAIVAGVLSGLSAAHEARDDDGQPLAIVHRDVSPQNVLVGMDGVARLLDFGIAKARSSAHVTRQGLLKGKLAYMSPEQLRTDAVTRRTDLYSCAVVLWELLAGARIHGDKTDPMIVAAVLHETRPRLAEAVADLRWADDERWEAIEKLDPVVAKALSRSAIDRYACSNDMLEALLAACPAATPVEVARWVQATGGSYLEQRELLFAANEESWRSSSRIKAALKTTSPPPAAGATPLAESAPPVAASPRSSSEFPRDWARSTLLSRSPRVAALALAGVLALVLAVRAGGPTPPPALPAPAPAAPPSAPVAIAPPIDPPEPLPAAAPSATATAPASSKRAHEAPAAPRPTPPPPPPRPAHNVSVPPAAASVVPGAPGAADCNPPFYFEGTKKLYKRGCL